MKKITLTKTVRIGNLRVPVEVMNKYKVLSKKHQMPVADIIRQVITKFAENE